MTSLFVGNEAWLTPEFWGLDQFDDRDDDGFLVGGSPDEFASGIYDLGGEVIGGGEFGRLESAKDCAEVIEDVLNFLGFGNHSSEVGAGFGYEFAVASVHDKGDHKDTIMGESGALAQG